MKNDNGGPAFPNVPDGAGDKWDSWDQGMTLHDYFAGKALQGFCANPAVFATNGVSGWALVNCSRLQLVDYCADLADAMLAKRAK